MTVELVFSDNAKETTEIAAPLPPVIKWFRRDLVSKTLEVFEVDPALISIPEVALRLDVSTLRRERPVYRQMQKPIIACCQFHNTGGSKAFRCGPDSADRTQYRLNKVQTEKLCQRMTEPLFGLELSRADAEALLDRMRIELERRIR